MESNLPLFALLVHVYMYVLYKVLSLEVHYYNELAMRPLLVVYLYTKHMYICICSYSFKFQDHKYSLL